MRPTARRLLLALLLAVPAVVPVGATTLLQMNLQDLCERSGRIFRGTVLSITQGSVQAGGGALPTLTYRFSVEETFLGTFTSSKGRQLAEMTTIGKIPSRQEGALRRLPVLPELPRMKVGQSYLLFVTAPSDAGLSVSVGLGQGCFHLEGSAAGRLEARNEFNNMGLFNGMTSSAALQAPPAGGAVPYSVLAGEIRALVGP
ncbi:MAG: hypothetical protein ACE5ID_00530 [Acidobacteriota bacterium]